MNLIDGLQMHADNPKTFYIPTESEKATLAEGDLVKIGVAIDEGSITAERLWVNITAIDGDTLTGTFANHPQLFDAKHGDEVQFEKRHILDIY